MPKIIIFLWQLCHRASPVQGTLFKTVLNIELVCPLYLGDIESTEHLFKDYSMVNRVWEMGDKHQWLLFNVSLAGCSDMQHNKEDSPLT